MKNEKSCGAVVFTRDADGIKYVIIDNADRELHGFPKGHVEGNETERETARREIFEEVGLDVSFIDGFREEDEYDIKGGAARKRVVFFLAEYENQTPRHQESELGGVELMTFNEAMKSLEFERNREILDAADKFLKGRP